MLVRTQHDRKRRNRLKACSSNQSLQGELHQAADDIGRGWVELQVVDLAGYWVSAAQADALNKNAVGHFELQKYICSNAEVGHCLGLGGSAGEAIEEPALGLDFRLAQLGLHHADDDVVRDKSTLGHVLLGFFAEGSAVLDLLTQDISGADVDDAVGLGDEFALSSFATAWRACDDDLRRAVALVVDALEELA